jgi:hypothetical protein
MVSDARHVHPGGTLAGNSIWSPKSVPCLFTICDNALSCQIAGYLIANDALVFGIHWRLRINYCLGEHEMHI